MKGWRCSNEQATKGADISEASIAFLFEGLVECSSAEPPSKHAMKKRFCG